MSYQDKQEKLVEELNHQFWNRDYKAEVASRVANYESDKRKFLSILAFPPERVVSFACGISSALATFDTGQFVIPKQALHITVKNVRTINQPPLFNDIDILKVSEIVKSLAHKYGPLEFKLKGTLLTPSSISLVAYSDERFSQLIKEIDLELNKNGVPDNKKYISNEIFFGNLTIFRYKNEPSKKLLEYLKQFTFENGPCFKVENLSLISSNLAFSPECYTNHVSVLI